MRRFLCRPLPAEGEAVLGAHASHHLLQVARIARGGQVGLFDGEGWQATAELVDVQDGHAVVRLTSPRVQAVPPRQTHLVLASLKGDAMAHALRMATEAGATHVWPVLTQRTIARGDKHDRWARILRSAAQQCGRADLPQLAPLRPLAEQVSLLPTHLVRFVAAPGAEPSPNHDDAVVAVGPEGGWTDPELTWFHEQGWAELGLGSWVLRADTAAAIAVSTLSP